MTHFGGSHGEDGEGGAPMLVYSEAWWRHYENHGIQALSTAKFDQMMALQPGWDSYGADAPTAEALTTAFFMAVVPTVDGGVQFEWHANGWDVELSFGPDGSPNAVVMEKDADNGGSHG